MYLPHASARVWKRWQVCVMSLTCLLTTVANSARAQSTLGCDVLGSDCDCPGCRAFLEGCEGYNLDSLTPDATSGATPYLGTPSESTDAIGQVAPMSPTDALAPNTFSPSPSSLASSLGGAGAGAGIPSMIGDFFGAGYNYQFINGATVATAGGDRRFKLAENNNPFPQDRFFFNYHHFDNALVNVLGNDANLDRYTFGLEKTLFSDRSSFEFRIPFATGLGTNPGGSSSVGQVTEFGNIALAVKQMLARTQHTAVSAGLGIVLPTGGSFSAATTRINNVFSNDAVHLLPFLGVYHESSPRLFSQFFLQFDFDPTGNDVVIGSQSGVLQDQTLMFLDYSAGYWLYRNRCNRHVRGFAPMIELHYSTTLQDQDYGPFANQQIFVEDARRDVLNLTGGLFFELGRMSSLKIGAVSPLRTGQRQDIRQRTGRAVHATLLNGATPRSSPSSDGESGAVACHWPRAFTHRAFIDVVSGICTCSMSSAGPAVGNCCGPAESAEDSAATVALTYRMSSSRETCRSPLPAN